MIYAQIKDGLVVNCIVLEHESIAFLFAQGFDHFIRIDNLSPQPGIGWSYENSEFIAPIIPEQESEEP